MEQLEQRIFLTGTPAIAFNLTYVNAYATVADDHSRSPLSTLPDITQTQNPAIVYEFDLTMCVSGLADSENFANAMFNITMGDGTVITATTASLAAPSYDYCPMLWIGGDPTYRAGAFNRPILSRSELDNGAVVIAAESFAAMKANPGADSPLDLGLVDVLWDGSSPVQLTIAPIYANDPGGHSLSTWENNSTGSGTALAWQNNQCSFTSNTIDFGDQSDYIPQAPTGGLQQGAGQTTQTQPYNSSQPTTIAGIQAYAGSVAVSIANCEGTPAASDFEVWTYTQGATTWTLANPTLPPPTQSGNVTTVSLPGLNTTMGGTWYRVVTGVSANTGLTIPALSDAYCLAGDINGDGTVDSGDYNIWAADAGKTGMTLAQGDTNGDGLVDSADYNIWAANAGQTTPTPNNEPTPPILPGIPLHSLTPIPTSDPYGHGYPVPAHTTYIRGTDPFTDSQAGDTDSSGYGVNGPSGPCADPGVSNVNTWAQVEATWGAALGASGTFQTPAQNPGMFAFLNHLGYYPMQIAWQPNLDTYTPQPGDCVIITQDLLPDPNNPSWPTLGIGVSGTPSEPITFMALPGAVVNITGTSYGIQIEGGSYLNIVGFTIHDSPTGIDMRNGDENHITFVGLNVYNCQDGFECMQNLHDIVVANCVIHDNGTSANYHGAYFGARDLANSDLYVYGNIFYGNSGNPAFQSNGPTTNLVFYDDIVCRNNAGGVSLEDGNCNSIIADNLIFDNSQEGIKFYTFGAAGQNDSWWDSPQTNDRVENNIVWENTSQTPAIRILDATDNSLGPMVNQVAITDNIIVAYDRSEIAIENNPNQPPNPINLGASTTLTGNWFFNALDQDAVVAFGFYKPYPLNYWDYCTEYELADLPGTAPNPDTQITASGNGWWGPPVFTGWSFTPGFSYDFSLLVAPPWAA